MSTGRPTALALTEYLLLSKRTRHVFDTEARQRMEAVEAAAIRDQLRPFLFEDLPDRPLGPLRMGVRFRPGQTFMEEPGVQLVIALEPQPRREETFAHEPDLVLDLALLPARGRRAGDRLDEMVRAHLEEAAIVLAVLADEDRLHRRLRVVVDAAPAAPIVISVNPRSAAMLANPCRKEYGVRP